MKTPLAALLSGLLFALGLTVSGMTLPARVLGFLDLAGDWDPTLAFVMLGALAVYAPAYRLIRARTRPLLDSSFHIPAHGKLEPALFAGSALFGIGWGLSGLCPGPALVALGAGKLEALVVVAAMCVGSALGTLFERTRASSEQRRALLREDA